MRLRFIQLLNAVKSRKCVVPQPTCSRRMMSNVATSVRENAVQPEPARPKGVPLALELGGINISEPPPRRPTLAEKLRARRAAMAGTAGNADSSSSDTVQTLAQESTPKEQQTPERAQRSENRPQRSGSSSGQRRPYEGRERSGRPPSRDGSQPRSQGAQRKPGQGGQRKPFQPGQKNAQAGGASQRKGGPAKAFSKGKQKKKRPTSFTKSGVKRVTDPELNDYPFEERNKPPIRKYDDDGLLVVKEGHVQLNPVVPPTLPIFATPRAPSSNTNVTAKNTPVTDTLRILSYVDRAPPKPAAETGNNVLGVVDNADLALSRVRDLGVRHRRDALGIVQKMSRPTQKSAAAPA